MKIHDVKDRRCILVLGMHRSGTSALTRCLNHLGVDLGKTLVPPEKDSNPLGHWENARVVEFNERLLALLGRNCHDDRLLPADWQDRSEVKSLEKDLKHLLEAEFSCPGPIGIKDPRLCRLLPAWMPQIRSSFGEPLVILALRHPSEVAGSLQRRNQLLMAQGYLQWTLHILEAERVTRDCRRFIVQFDSLLEDWATELLPIMDLVGTDRYTSKSVHKSIENFLTPSLRHHHARTVSVPDDAGPIREIAEAVFRLMEEDNLQHQAEELDALYEQIVAIARLISPFSERMILNSQQSLRNCSELEARCEWAEAELARFLNHPVLGLAAKIWSSLFNASFPAGKARLLRIRNLLTQGSDELADREEQVKSDSASLMTDHSSRADNRGP